MADYKFKRNKDEEGYFILEDGHTMFPEDVKKRLKRLNFLESERSAMCEANSNAVLADVTANDIEIIINALNYILISIGITDKNYSAKINRVLNKLKRN